MNRLKLSEIDINLGEWMAIIKCVCNFFSFFSENWKFGGKQKFKEIIFVW
jgi:hypothetical protein